MQKSCYATGCKTNKHTNPDVNWGMYMPEYSLMLGREVNSTTTDDS